MNSVLLYKSKVVMLMNIICTSASHYTFDFLKNGWALVYWFRKLYLLIVISEDGIFRSFDLPCTHRTDETDALVQLVEQALLCRSCLREIVNFASANVDIDLSIISDRLTVAIKASCYFIIIFLNFLFLLYCDFVWFKCSALYICQEL